MWGPPDVRTSRMRVAFLPTLSGALTLLLLLGGCGIFTQRPEPIPPAAELYERGEAELDRRRYEDARINFKRIVERHPDFSLAPRPRKVCAPSPHGGGASRHADEKGGVDGEGPGPKEGRGLTGRLDRDPQGP